LLKKCPPSIHKFLTAFYFTLLVVVLGFSTTMGRVDFAPFGEGKFVTQVGAIQTDEFQLE
jgi:hypothetical protein